MDFVRTLFNYIQTKMFRSQTLNVMTPFVDKDETAEEHDHDGYESYSSYEDEPSDEQIQASIDAEEEYLNYLWHKDRGDINEDTPPPN